MKGAYGGYHILVGLINIPKAASLSSHSAAVISILSYVNVSGRIG